MTARLLLSALLLTLLLPSEHARAQDLTDNACAVQIYAGLATEHRVFRSVLYGQLAAQAEPIGNVRYDKEGNPWLKTAYNEWKSLAKGYEGTTWRDILMDEQGAAPPRRGLFERKRAVTSDILPEVIQSVRALQCRLRAVCELARESRGLPPETNTDFPILIQPLGCIEQEMLPMKQCLPRLDVAEVTIAACDEAVKSILDREMKLLEMQIAYDAAYRTLLQFAGQMEGFMEDFRLPLLQPLWQTVDALSGFDGMTCFLSQCDE